jgi:hypothetical protein
MEQSSRCAATVGGSPVHTPGSKGSVYAVDRSELTHDRAHYRAIKFCSCFIASHRCIVRFPSSDLASSGTVLTHEAFRYVLDERRR